MTRTPADWYVIGLLALVTWREARGEGMDGMRAVMHVIRNRHLIWGQDWNTVITARNQFSSMATAGDAQLIQWPPTNTPLFQSILELAAKVFDGEDDDTTDGALYYYNPATATSKWFTDNVVSKMAKVATVGRHEFFRPGPLEPPVSS